MMVVSPQQKNLFEQNMRGLVGSPVPDEAGRKSKRGCSEARGSLGTFLGRRLHPVPAGLMLRNR